MPKINGFEILEIHSFDFEIWDRQVKENKNKVKKLIRNKKKNTKKLNIILVGNRNNWSNFQELD